MVGVWGMGCAAVRCGMRHKIVDCLAHLHVLTKQTKTQKTKTINDQRLRFQRISSCMAEKQTDTMAM